MAIRSPAMSSLGLPRIKIRRTGKGKKPLIKRSRRPKKLVESKPKASKQRVKIIKSPRQRKVKRKTISPIIKRLKNLS